MTINTSIAPWLTYAHPAIAVAFYKKAFGAIETYRLDLSDTDMVVKLAVDGAEFWISSGEVPNRSGNHGVRFILTTADPESMMKMAIKAGGIEIFPVGVSHGWKLGRIADPFGLHWEIGHPVEEATG